MIASDAVAALRPRPSGPPLRGRAPLRDGIMEGRLVGRQNTEQGTAGSTLSSPIRGLRLGVGAKAFFWYEKAAAQNYAQGQYGLSDCYLYGYGVEQNLAEGARLLRLSAEQEFAEAEASLGHALYYGNFGFNKNPEEAVKWFLSAADKGNAEACDWLSTAYREGLGIEQNVQKSHEWLIKALELEPERPSLAYDLVMYRMLAGDYELSVPELTFKLHKHFAEVECKDYAQFHLAYCYLAGKGVTQNHPEAARWFQKAADQGIAAAQFNLGLMSSKGGGLVKNERDAVKWYRLAAEQGHVDAQLNLGVYYWDGKGVLEDYVEAYAWLALASMNGSSLAQNNKEILGQKLSFSQIAAGQQRAKELQALIERKKAIAESESDKPIESDIAPSGFGSGLFVKGGYVLTCWHVVEDAERISVSLEGKDHLASVVQKDAANDIAVLKVGDVSGGAALNLTDDAKLGEKVFTLGYPHPDLQGSDVKFTTGSISSLTGVGNSPLYFQISAPLQSGNSGSPLFDEKGNLVGIVAAKLDSLATLALTGDLPQNVNYAIKADYLEPLLKTVPGLEIEKEKTKDVNLLELIEELKQSVVMIKVY